ncbi:hypothetical protein [Paenibacillus bovis]|uniref:Uncharacterized protein n=1 Tax=Paenibacillus bovis TaxID=1616788 RepID=A0A172ZAX7_9BACL|nr:hypothetical protein [Paenibacillus bovis]ANF94795.1 hypothetical protein AR543_01270 [Paenibacillus bovis]
MKKFKNQYPDYKSYLNDDYVMNEVPHKLITSLTSIYIEGVNRKVSNYSGIGRLDYDSVMRNIVNKVAEYAYTDLTQNWGGDYLIQDLRRNISELGQLPSFSRIMDSISDLAFNTFDSYITDDLNELFETVGFGYRLTENQEEPWIIINPNIGTSVKIDTIAELTQKLCKQTTDHILQAKEQLKKAENPRARKDAIRDCLSAMEALMKHITNTKDVAGANNLMVKASEVWGPKVIVTDGHKLWKIFHEDYSDIRHGNSDISNINIEEARYFIDRILIYVDYISKIALKELS